MAAKRRLTKNLVATLCAVNELTEKNPKTKSFSQAEIASQAGVSFPTLTSDLNNMISDVGSSHRLLVLHTNTTGEGKETFRFSMSDFGREVVYRIDDERLGRLEIFRVINRLPAIV